MKKILIISLFLLFIPLISKALTGTASQIGGTTHYNFSDGTSGTSYNISGTTHYNFSDGTSGTAYDIGGVMHYSFTDPLSKSSYDLGGGNTINYPVYQYTPGEFFSNNGSVLINNTCKGLSSTLYPDWINESNKITLKCMGEERIKVSDSDWDNVHAFNTIDKCNHQGPSDALKEILDICTKEQAKLYIDRVNLIQSNLQKKEQGPCPQFSVFWTDAPMGTKDTEQFFSINKNSYCVCYLDYRNYKRSCITEVEYNKKIQNKSVVDVVFAKKLGGKILLQIESRGEAWYVNPETSEKYYMADGEKAFNIMRNLGVGITNKDLDKIKSNKTFAKNNSGKIFLQVEAKGEAYYIDFNGVAHYLKDGTAAYEVMRSLGLGITNDNLNKIAEGL